MIAGFFRAVLAPFAGRPPILAELVWGAITGLLLFVVFRQFGNAPAVSEWRRKRSGHLLGLYIFGDDPALSLRSLGEIARANAALLLYALPPLLASAPFIALIAVNLNQFFTTTPLADGGAAVLTVRFRLGSAPQPCEASLSAPDWIQVDSPPVHVPASQEISWRIRAKAKRAGVVEVNCGVERATKEIDARPGPRYFGKARERGLVAWLLHPGESRLPEGPIARIWLSQSVEGPWAIWFGLIAGSVAWLASVASRAAHRYFR